MAMSLKKITAIAVGGAMVASTLATGVAAAEVVKVNEGDIKEFMKNVVKDGKPNVDIVVGSKGAAMDVVAAADIAAKIGSMCYKDVKIEDGLAELSISVSADSELSKNLISDYNVSDEIILFVTPRRSYKTNLGKVDTLEGLVEINTSKAVVDEEIARLSTLTKDSDADPDDVSDDTKADAIEFLLGVVYKENNESFKIEGKDLVYGTLMFGDGGKSISELQELYIGMEIPLLGEIYRIVDTDEKEIYLGKEVYSGKVKEGKIIDVGNGYQVKIESVLVALDNPNINKPEVTVEIIKDGKVVETKSDEIPYEFVYKDIGVIVYSTYTDVPSDHGYASIIVTKNVKGYEIGKPFEGDWKLYAITKKNNALEITKKDFKEEKKAKTKYLENKDGKIYGLALRYEGDDFKNLEDGDTVDFIYDYAMIEFTDDDEDNALFARYKTEISKDVTLEIGKKVEILNAKLKLKDIKATAQQVVPVKTPVAKLDTEASLDTDKYLILVGGPVVNKLTEELQKQGKINIDNNSPPTLVVVDGKILVVAGGDRYKTRKAALELIKNY
ncbi:MAG TPA: S-layer protein [Methanothermococcus okinawensis]|uniref:S-layer protein n=1 Tax=Methanothermococcus okinawensis TaxID=155863 RepID=A0A832ZHB2_9EURY|nr:S-layer protein [Methanothermococcus okinawensis]